MRQTLLLLVGWGVLVLGLVSLLDDLLWGLLLAILGLYLLSFEQPWVRARRAGLERRYPEAAGWLAKAEARLQELYAKATGRPPDDEDQPPPPGGGRTGRRR